MVPQDRKHGDGISLPEGPEKGGAPGRRTIRAEEVVRFAPGDILAEARFRKSPDDMLLYREFAYQPQAVDVPGIDSVLLVIYRDGHTRMRRTLGGPWKERRVAAGNISVLGVGQASVWEWDRQIRVSHLYLPRAIMDRAAQSAFACDYRAFSPTDRLSIDDPVLLGLADALTGELGGGQGGDRLLCDLVSRAVALHVLRRYHHCPRLPEPPDDGTQLTPAQRRRVLEFIEANLGRDFSLAQLAQAAGLGEGAFLRRFKGSFASTPWQFVMAERTKRALRMITETRLPLAEIAYRAGFSDQSHMTRMVRKHTGTTPGRLRSESRG